ncbi:MAG: HAD family hydrolase [Cyclobacteriaceae bacterium]
MNLVGHTDVHYKGVIFDFNGTLFWDTPYHNQAWNQFLEAHDIHMSDMEMIQKIHGKTNAAIFRNLFGPDLEPWRINQMAQDKESIYRKLCSKQQMQLAPGVSELLQFLKDIGIPFTIATASGADNLDFYFEHLSLNRWFNFDKVVYDNGTFPGKPEPDIFLLAAKQLKLSSKETVIFEDSFAGILAAENAGAGKIFIVNSNKDDYSQWHYKIITDFDQVERSIFVKSP